VTHVTAEPRMEELLASIRKAIHDDIGEVPSALSTNMSARSSGTLQRGSLRELHVKAGEEAASAAAEIQQLREKIIRSRGPEAAPLRESNLRPANASATLQSETPKRSWRELEPQPRLRPSIVEPEYTPPLRAEQPPRYEPEARFEPVPEPPRYHEAVQATWREEPAALPPPRESYKPIPNPSAMLSGDASQAVQSAFNRLADSVLSRATGDKSIEDLTRELLRGMLKQWLDDNLPALVERLVREEIERVARHGR
jgi:cell pole-organizing protein PopZ